MNTWDMINEGDRIVAGLSGGADSVALLLVLEALRKKYDLKLYAVHVNHMIRSEATQDAEFAKTLCASYDIPFYLYEEDIEKLAGEQRVGVEEMGRMYRYARFEDVRKHVGADKIAVAHHMDDQAETVLFHLVRGSDIAGMEGMRPVSDKLIRPLLCCKKQELVRWLQDRNIAWMEDCTNGDDAYARNLIRNRVLPELSRVNSRAVEHIADFSKQAGAYKRFFEKMVHTYVKEHVRFAEGACEVDRYHLLQQDALLVKSVIYEMLVGVSGCRKDIGSVHVENVYELLYNQSGKKVMLPYEMTAYLSYEVLKIGKSLESTVNACDFQIDIAYMLQDGNTFCALELPERRICSIELFRREEYEQKEWMNLVNMAINSKNNYTKYFECDTMKFALHVRNAEINDVIVINDNGNTKKLSRYFIDEKISIEQRRKAIVLSEDNNVLWVLGGRRSTSYKIREDSRLIMKVEYKGEKE